MVKIVQYQILLDQHFTALTTVAEFNMPGDASLGDEIPASKTVIRYQDIVTACPECIARQRNLLLFPLTNMLYRNIEQACYNSWHTKSTGV